MGINIFKGHRPGSSSSFEKSVTVASPAKQKKIKGNPDPNNWQLIRAKSFAGGFLLIELEYPDCSNYEGRKILVFKDVDSKALFAQGAIDPHFFPDGKYKSPMARFEPTDRGWSMAEIMIEAVNSRSK